MNEAGTTQSPFELPFAAASRAEHWRALAGREFDLLVVGGGITGAGVALDAAGRGLDVALVEAGDFGTGTSSRSSRLIHGGLRYLETLDFGLVFEALGERRRLLDLAPHLVHPLSFLFPVYRGGPVGMLQLRAGMWLYDTLSLFRGVPRHQMLSGDAVARREPALDAEGLAGGAIYTDAQVDDARLTLAVARAAHEAGVVTVPHAAVVGFVRSHDGMLRGARVEDRLVGSEVEVRARLVVSATGPWTDELRRLADPTITPRLRPTKGVHVQLRRERVGHRGAIIFRSAVDGRVMFVLPWGDFTYIGTTDTDYGGSPDAAEATAEDVRYLLRSANALFPAARLSEGDVVSTWSGIRPLLAPPSASSEGGTSREHEIWRDPSGLLCVAGGKLTTYRTMAAEVAREAAATLRAEHGVRSGEFHSEHLPLPGAPRQPWERFLAEFRREARETGVDERTAIHLARAYGTEARDVLRLAREEPELATPIVPRLPYIWAEVPHAVRCEMATTLEDVMRRRLHIFYDAPDGGMAVADGVAARMAAEPGLGWDEAEIAAQVRRYGAAVERTRPATPR